MLLDEVVVSPQRRDEEEDEACTGENRQGADGEEQKRPPEQAPARASLLAVEVGARERCEDVRRVNEHGPCDDHRNERHYPGDVERKQRVARHDRPDEPYEVVARADDPAQTDGARRGRGGQSRFDLRRSGHKNLCVVSCVDSGASRRT